jgi:hypothetical protein
VAAAIAQRAAYQGLARAYRVLGRQQQAAEAVRRSGLGPAATDRPPMFTSFSVTARDGMRLSAPGVLNPAPGAHARTHAHFDHVGGSEAMRGPDTQVIASAGFPAEADRLRHWNLPFRYFTGPAASPATDVKPDRLISERTSLVVGDTLTRAARKRQRRLSTCSPGRRQTLS